MDKFTLRIASLIGICLYCTTIVLAQYPDNNWLLGYAYSDSINNEFGLTQLNFTKNQLSIGEETELLYRLGHHNSIISSSNGEDILFFFNGLQVREGDYDLAVNGDDMYSGPLSLGYDRPQGSLILPFPDNDERYLLLSTYVADNEDLSTVTGHELNYSILEVDEDNRVTVVEKNQLLETGALHNGQLTATRHANGRDWWIIWPYYSSNRYMRFLLTPQGLERQEDQYSAETTRTGSGQASFSPDGNYFVMFNGVSSTEGDFFDQYDFDRCTGLLSNHRHYNLPDNGGGAGCAVSHDSRYAYIFSTGYVFQIDLWTDDNISTLDTVAVYDGGLDPFPTLFNRGQLARDGKIYMSSTGSMTKLHVIDYPNRQGAACNVRQRGIELPVHISFGVPNFPFHRLGPLDGSPCDTLGIDNVPLADFRSDQDSSEYRQFFFQNLSTYEPASWSWSFGDGSMSQDTSPVHTYAEGGSYEVCLTVSNEYGTDTSCDSLHLGVVNSVEPAAPKARWQVFPNPARDYFTFNLLDYYPREAYLELYNSVGQRVQRQRIFAGWNTMEIADLSSGVYTYQLWDSGTHLGGGKIIKVG
jgi:hypothetical protein